jgi:site-specific recombinase XerC
MPPRRECVPSSQRDSYIDYRRTSGITEISVRISERYIDEFLRFCKEERGHSEARKVTRLQISDFASHQSRLGILPATVNRKVHEVVNWLAWLKEKGVLKRNPAEKIST